MILVFASRRFIQDFQNVMPLLQQLPAGDFAEI